MFNFEFKIPFHLMVADLMPFVVQLVIQYTPIVYTWRVVAGTLKFRTDNSQSYTKGYPSSKKTEEYYFSSDWVCCEWYRRCKEFFQGHTRGHSPVGGLRNLHDWEFFLHPWSDLCSYRGKFEECQSVVAPNWRIHCLHSPWLQDDIPHIQWAVFQA